MIYLYIPSLVPDKYKEKNIRALPYLYPTKLNLVVYAKQMQELAFYQALEVAENLARRQGFMLVPWSCLHWQRAKAYGPDRKIKIGRNSFFLLKPNELTKGEIKKLEQYYTEELDKEIKIG